MTCRFIGNGEETVDSTLWHGVTMNGYDTLCSLPLDCMCGDYELRPSRVVTCVECANHIRHYRKSGFRCE